MADSLLPAFYALEVFGIQVPYDIYVHISGMEPDPWKDRTFISWKITCALNFGVSFFVLENREVTKRLFQICWQPIVLRDG